MLHQSIVRVQPMWLLIGQEPDGETLWTLAARAARIAPWIHIAVVGDAEDIERCESWLRHGARVYVAQPVSLATMAGDLYFAMMRDRLVIDACFQRILWERQRTVAIGVPAESAGFTRRELEVLELMCRGRRNAEIAAALQVAGTTVDFHVRHILAKLGATNRTEAAEHARLLGLIGHLRKS
jgi:DNA-binding NarL/FixJ family response regulator